MWASLYEGTIIRIKEDLAIRKRVEEERYKKYKKKKEEWKNKKTKRIRK